LALGTEGNASSLSPTITASEGGQGKNPKARGLKLHYVAENPQMFPTPCVADATVGNVIGKNDTFRLTKNGTWRRHLKGDKANGSLQLAKWVMFPTPSVADTMGGIRKNLCGRRMHQKLRDEVARLEMFPTPIAGDWKGQKRKDGTANMLSGKIENGMFPTPKATSGMHKDNPGERRRKSPDLETQIKMRMGMPIEASGRLNPTWVEWLQGFPMHWTRL